MSLVVSLSCTASLSFCPFPQACFNNVSGTKHMNVLLVTTSEGVAVVTFSISRILSITVWNRNELFEPK